MDVSIHRYSDVVVVTPGGRVDHAGAEALQRELAPITEAASEGALVLDFAQVDYTSSVGLRVLMVASRQLRTRGGRIAIAALQPTVREILEIARFQHVVEIFETLRDALAALSPAALAAFDTDAGTRAP